MVIFRIVVFSKELRLPTLDADEAEVYNHCLPLGNRVIFDLFKFDWGRTQSHPEAIFLSTTLVTCFIIVLQVAVIAQFLTNTIEDKLLGTSNHAIFK